ncbi:MAG: diaminopimelate epimerase [Bacteroidales bacterium]|nr:diaminopimelate epimerase [Bacteroidales bacterium]
MTIRLIKAHGAGNDFILLDDRNNCIWWDEKTIKKLCDRHKGVGADGLIVIRPSEVADFKMEYFNSDGSRAIMCANGARCAVAFAHYYRLFNGQRCSFETDDGLHEGFLRAITFPEYQIEVDIYIHSSIREIDSNSWLIDTGVPHIILRVEDVSKVNIKEEALKYRFREDLAPGGVNVNFVDIQFDKIRIRTYERGVEGETLSCGTGVSAAAWLAHELGWYSENQIRIHAPGGEFEVTCFPTKLMLKGPVELVGMIELFESESNNL